MDNTPRAGRWQPALAIFARLSGWIAAPVILAVFVGKWLDRKFGSEPWLFLACVGAAFVVSMFGIVRDSMREMNKIERENQK